MKCIQKFNLAYKRLGATWSNPMLFLDIGLRVNAVQNILHSQREYRTKRKILQPEVYRNMSTPSSFRDHAKLADFILFSQREFLLNLSKELSRDNISFAQFFLLSYMASGKELIMTDIARKMGHSTAAATGLVDRLEKLSLLERTHALDDRRKIMVRILPKGLLIVSRLKDELQSQVAAAIDDSETSKEFGIFDSKPPGTFS